MLSHSIVSQDRCAQVTLTVWLSGGEINRRKMVLLLPKNKKEQHRQLFLPNFFHKVLTSLQEHSNSIRD